MSTKFFVDDAGNYIGGFDGAEPPAGAIEVAPPPDDARQKWNGEEWLPLATVDPLTTPLPRLEFWLAAAQANVSKWSIRDRIAAMTEGVEKWEAIAWFEEAVQYRRDDPILVAQAALESITPEQLDALWIWALQTYDLLPSPS